MKTYWALVWFAVACAAPLFVWIYPVFFDWMSSPAPDYAARTWGVIFMAFALFFLIWGSGMAVLSQLRNYGERRDK